MGASGSPQGEAKGSDPSRSEGSEPSDPVRRSGADSEEIRRRFEQESRSGASEREEAGRRDWTGGAGPRGGGGETDDSEGSSGEEDEPSGIGETDKRADSGCARIRKWEGGAESGGFVEDGEGFGREASRQIGEVRFEFKTVFRPRVLM